MKRLLMLLLLLAPVCALGQDTRVARLSPAMMGSVPTGNDFSGDANCVAVWNIDSDALGTDSLGPNYTTLINSGVAWDTTNQKRGTGCGDFDPAGSDYMYCADANLEAGFPLKNGDSKKEISVCAWIRAHAFTGPTEVDTIFTKGDSDGNDISFAAIVYEIGGIHVPGIDIATGGGTAHQFYWHDSGLSTDTWYHITWTYEDSGKSYAIRVRDQYGAVVGTDETGNAATNISVSDGSATIGAIVASGIPQQFFDGLIDEVVVFNDVLSLAESNKIALGTYP